MKNTAQSLTIGFVTVAAGTVAFHIAAARFLGPKEYGSLGAMLTILLILSVPAGAVQVALTAEVSRIADKGNRILWLPLLLKFSAIGTACATCLVLVSPLLSSYIGAAGVTPFIMLALFAIPAMGTIVTRSVLLGRRQYRRLAAVLIATSALRLAIGIAAIALVPSAQMAMVSLVVSEVVLFVALYRACITDDDRLPWELTLTNSELWGAVLAFTAFWLLVGADALIAKRQFSAEVAGTFAATALVARTVLYIPQAITSAALPDLTQIGDKGVAALRKVVETSLFFGLFAAVAISVGAPKVIAVILGEGYRISVPTLTLLSISAVLAGLLNALITYRLAQGSVVRSNAAWLGFFALLVVGHLVSQPTQLALVTLIGVLGSCFFIFSGLGKQQFIGHAMLTEPSVDISLIMPVYNEGIKSLETVLAADAMLAETLRSYEIIVVDDCSTSGVWTSKNVNLDVILPETVTPLRLERNGGKGTALREGFSQAKGEYVSFLDGDGDIEVATLAEMLEEMSHYQCDGIIGSKAHPHSFTKRSFSRSILSSVSTRLISFLFSVNVSDTQVGVKVFRRNVVEAAMASTQETGFMFDLEFLALATARGHGHFIEHPVHIEDHEASSVSLRSSAVALGNVAALAWRWHSSSAYERRGAYANSGV